MLIKDYIYLIIAAVIAVGAGVAIYEYVHTHHHPQPGPTPPPPTPNKPIPIVTPDKFGMQAVPGKKIVPHSSNALIFSEYMHVGGCDAKLRSLLTTGTAIGGANYGIDPSDGNAPYCFLYGPLNWGEYTLVDDPYMTAYIGRATPS